MSGIKLACPHCGAPTSEGWEDIEDKPSEEWDSHFIAVTCECEETYEIVFSASDILFWDEEGEPQYALSQCVERKN